MKQRVIFEILFFTSRASEFGLRFLRRRYAREHLQQAAPVAFGLEDAAHLVAARSVAIETSVFKLNTSRVFSVGNEAELNFRF